MKIRVLQPGVDAMSECTLRTWPQISWETWKASWEGGRLITTPLDGAKLRKKRAVAAAAVDIVTGIKPPFKRRPRNRRLFDLSNMQSPNPNSRFPSYFGPSGESSLGRCCVHAEEESESNAKTSSILEFNTSTMRIEPRALKCL